MKYLILILIYIYQKTLSFDHGLMHKIFPGVRVCIYHPSCSEYGFLSIKKYGTFIGGYLATRRVLSCGPWYSGGHDPVKELNLPSWTRYITWF